MTLSVYQEVLDFGKICKLCLLALQSTTPCYIGTKCVRERDRDREGFEGGGAVPGSKSGGASAATLGSVVYLYHVQLKPCSRPKKAKEK
jgi:hypothetical protein